MFFFSLKNTFIHVKKCDFYAYARFSYDPVITKHGICHCGFPPLFNPGWYFFFSLKNTFMHVKNAILMRALVGRTILSLLRINSSMPLRLSAIIQSMMIFFFSLKNTFIHVKNAILTRALVVRRVMLPLSISANEKIAFFLIFYNILICRWKCILYVK